MKERLRWLGHVVWMKDDIFPNIFLFGHLSRAKRKVGCPRLGWEDTIKKDLKETGTCWEGFKEEALNRLRWRWSVPSCFGLRWLGAETTC